MIDVDLAGGEKNEQLCTAAFSYAMAETAEMAKIAR